jgi:hypothetical protein
VGPQRRAQPGRLDALGDRRALAAGDDEAVKANQINRGSDLGCLRPKLAQRAGVRLEAALDR